jgi:YebC/PmpR family DNA-binding regulatory protein
MGAQWKAKGKELAANARGRVFGKLSKDIMVAARSGADPAANSRLRLLVEQARKVSMPKDTLDRAIKKGSGTGAEAVHFEHVIYEGFAPHRVPVMVECLTDNLNRTASEVRVLFRKGQLGAAGSVGWDFDHVGMIEAEPTAPGADPEVAAIEAGAQDFEPGDDRPRRPRPREPRPPRARLHRAVGQARLQAEEPDRPVNAQPGGPA